ncbi:MAG: 2-hydroxyacyl-CoA dehydratase subunit D [Promethearchaeota archaeon]
MSLENDSFLKISQGIMNPYIQEWRKNGKKVIGYYCTYLPEELIHAAGILPFRIRATGSETEDLADVYMVRFTCGFVRMTLDLALRGGYDFLDGLFICNCCDHARRMYELFDLVIFKREVFMENKPPCFYTSIPHTITNEGYEWYKKEVEEFKIELKKYYNLNSISNEILKNSIKVYNENRSLLRDIYSLKIIDEPKLTGSEFLQISMSNSSVPKEIANRELTRILKILEEREGFKEKKKRILLIGSVVDNTNFIKVIEDSGAHVISDFLCFGLRNIIDDVKTDGDLFDNICRRTYYRMSCPRMMDDHPRRFKFLKEEIKKAKIDGVIMQRINNCDLHGCENMLCEHEFKDMGIPAFNIDRESFQADTTRLQTRIEAFLEMLK